MTRKRKKKKSPSAAWAKTLYEQRKERLAGQEPRSVEPRPVKQYFR